MKRDFIFFNLIICFTFLTSGCETYLNGCPKDTEYDMCYRATSFKLFSADNTENLLAINSWRYDKDSIKIFDDHWNEYDFNLRNDGSVEMDLRDNNYPLNVDINRTFYLKLEPKDIDTIRFQYKLREECDYLQFEFFKGTYNSTSYSPSNLCPPRFDFFKK